MNEEIKKLIDFAITDGFVSDKDRKILRKKAEKLGEDPDEVEMILEAELIRSTKMRNAASSMPPPTKQLSPSPSPSPSPPPPPPVSSTIPPPVQEKKKQKRGIIETCPSCGTESKSMELLCSECGHEYANYDSESGIKLLKQKLQDILDSIITVGNENLNSSFFSGMQGEKVCSAFQQQGNFIRSYSFENTKEELIEHLTYSLSQVKSLHLEIDDINARIGSKLENDNDKNLLSSINFLSNAWESLLEQCISKAKLFITDEKELSKILSLIDQQESDFQESELKEVFYSSGQLKSQGKIKIKRTAGSSREIQIGIHKSWFENGQLKEEKSYNEQGNLEGHQREWHDNGQLKLEFNTINGNIEGTIRSWFSNGQLSSEVFSKENNRYGPERYWYENGHMKMKQNLIQLKLNYISTVWYENGQPMLHEFYNSDSFIGGLYFDKKGNRVSSDKISKPLNNVIESIKRINYSN